MSGASKPSLVKSTALSKAQAIFSRINSLLPGYSTPISPVTVYQPLPVNNIMGNEMLAAPTGYSGSTTNALWGVWTAPNINNGADYSVQIECFAAGGGGGGGNGAVGGGGGAGGGYAVEPTYTVTPGLPYIWIRGTGGPGGAAQPTSGGNQTIEGGAGIPGGDTIFDLAGTGLPGGVHAYGGGPGDVKAAGQGGTIGTASANTLNSAGGAGGTNNSGVASDNPNAFFGNSTYWVQPATGPATISTWMPMDDIGIFGLNNAANTGTSEGVQGFTSPLLSVTSPAAALQVPTSNLPAGIYGNNATQYAGCQQFKMSSPAKPAAQITCTSFSFAGESLMVSGWIQCDPTGIWGNPGNGDNATIATNCQYTSGKSGSALYFTYQGGVPTLNWYCSNGVTPKTVSTTAVPATPGTWYYVVGVYQGSSTTGTMTLYVNHTSVGSTSTPWGSVIGGAYAMNLGLRADTTSGQYFGYMSNFWFAQAVPSATLLATAWGAVPATGGAGGGSSGGPYYAGTSLNAQYTSGNAGNSAVVTAGGAGGTVAPLSPYTSAYSASGAPGGAGANANTTNAGTAPGPGSGGGGAGDSASTLTVSTLTVPIATAATYNGNDGTQAGVLYNPNQQGTQGTLVAGGQAADPVTGSKVSILLLPPGLAAQLSGKTIVDCYLTVYNANANNTITPVLEVNYSADAVLPSNFSASAAYGIGGMTQTAPYVLENITTAQVISLMNTANQGFSSFTAALQSGAATAIVLGPEQNSSPYYPTFDAYNATAGNYFYTSIYGPGSTNSFGQSIAPVLTIAYVTGTPQVGQNGGGGAVSVTSINNGGTPVAAIQPFAVSDADGNQFAEGYTGPVTAFQPGLSPGSYVAEVWHPLAPYLASQWTAVGAMPPLFRLTAQGDVELTGSVVPASGGVVSSDTTIATLPANYFSANATFRVPCALISGTISTTTTGYYLALTTSGTLVIHNVTVGDSTPTLNLDGVTIPLSAADLY